QSILAMLVGCAPHRANVDLVFLLRVLGRLPPLLFDVGLDHRGGGARGEVAVFTFLEQGAYDNFGIPSRLDAYEPPVVREVFACRSQTRLQSVADGLRAPRLAGEIDALQMRTGSGSPGIDHARHGIGNDLPILWINRDLTPIRYAGGRNHAR